LVIDARYRVLSECIGHMNSRSLSNHSRKSALGMTGRVLIRQPTLEDSEEFVDVMHASRRFHRPWVTPPLDANEFRAYVERSRASDFLGSLVCRVADGRILGVCNLSQIVHGRFQNGYLGYYVGAPYSRQGYMSEAIQLVLRHVFRSLKLHRLEANIQPENTRSILLVERCGFQLEGYSPGYLKIGGRWRDHERWAIRREIWRPSGAVTT
jgi:ribosomal-protein-alanine N-acetyltransferase